MLQEDDFNPQVNNLAVEQVGSGKEV